MLLYGCSFVAWWHSSNTINVNTFNDSTWCLFKAFNRICGVITIMSYFSIRLLIGTFWLTWISLLRPQILNLLRYVRYIRVCWDTSSVVGTKNAILFWSAESKKCFWNDRQEVTGFTDTKRTLTVNFFRLSHTTYLNYMWVYERTDFNVSVCKRGCTYISTHSTRHKVI